MQVLVRPAVAKPFPQSLLMAFCRDGILALVFEYLTRSPLPTIWSGSFLQSGQYHSSSSGTLSKGGFRHHKWVTYWHSWNEKENIGIYYHFFHIRCYIPRKIIALLEHLFLHTQSSHILGIFSPRHFCTFCKSLQT